MAGNAWEGAMAAGQEGGNVCQEHIQRVGNSGSFSQVPSAALAEDLSQKLKIQFGAVVEPLKTS